MIIQIGIVLNKAEAEIVKYIFKRYISGIGNDTIAKELEELGHKTKRGSSKWCGSTVMGIIKNEKYVGDVMFGKSFTADPITKRRLKNLGEEDKFYIRDYHEPIIDRETFELACRIREQRNVHRGEYKDGDKVTRKARYTRKHNFSSMLRCGCCGELLTRRWHARSGHEKTVWQCISATKKGKRFCPDSKAIDEKAIERAFMKSYELLYEKDHSLLNEFLDNVREVLNKDSSGESVQKARANLAKTKQKKENLLNLKLSGLIEDDVFAEKNFILSQRIDSLEKTLEHLSLESKERNAMERRIKKFQKTIESSEAVEDFSREVFESVINYVVVGGYDENGVEDPTKLTFVYKSGESNKLDAKDFKLRQQKTAACYMDLNKGPFEGYMEVLHFEFYDPHSVFSDTHYKGRCKTLKYTRNVSVGIIA